MSAQRPSEADVEALAKVVAEAFGVETGPHDLRVARAVLASGWLAARDAEHEREVADLRAAIKALADEWEAIDGEPATDRDLAVMTVWNRAGRRLRALLPRDDAAGAGGAS